MKIMISYQCDTVAEAKAVMEAVEGREKNFNLLRVQDTPEKVFALAELQRAVREDRPINIDAHSSGPELDRPNVTPGAPAIGKIGSKAKDEIIGMLTLKPKQMPGKWSEHLKLLWSRGEVKFDGTSFYL